MSIVSLSSLGQPFPIFYSVLWVFLFFQHKSIFIPQLYSPDLSSFQAKTEADHESSSNYPLE